VIETAPTIFIGCTRSVFNVRHHSNVEHWSEEIQAERARSVVASAKYLASRNVDYIMHCGMPV